MNNKGSMFFGSRQLKVAEMDRRSRGAGGGQKNVKPQESAALSARRPKLVTNRPSKNKHAIFAPSKRAGGLTGTTNNPCFHISLAYAHTFVAELNY